VKVTGFTFIRNAVTFDYPIVESITSILPICDEFIVAVGNSSDNTMQLIASIKSDKIRIIETVWDETAFEGGRVLAMETDKAFAAISADTDWCFYLQGDEVVHEQYLSTIVDGMKRWKDDTSIDGLLFKYLHFYGSYDYVGASSRWYRNEIRIIRNNVSIYSYRDAQGFRKGDNQKLKVKELDAYIYHYGWVKEPKTMQEKHLSSIRFYRSDSWIEENVVKVSEFDYSGIDALEVFKGTHPTVMLDRIHNKNWKFEHSLSFNKLSLKDSIKRFLDTYFGIKLGYRNYRL